MTYPIDVEQFVKKHVMLLDNPDIGDQEVFKAAAIVMNKAFYAGLEEGKREAATCKE